MTIAISLLAVIVVSFFYRNDNPRMNRKEPTSIPINIDAACLYHELLVFILVLAPGRWNQFS